MKSGSICDIKIAGKTETQKLHNKVSYRYRLKYEYQTHIPKTLYCKSRTLFPSWSRDKDTKSEMKA